MRSLRRASQLRGRPLRLPLRPSTGLPRPSSLAPSSTAANITTTASASASASASTSSSTTTAPTATPIPSLLIANRGEIALRIARTAAAMGIRATTVYTDVDAGAPHARAAPHSLALGAATAGYLDGERLVALARQHGIAAVHPGYGFLSENAGFARACEAAGLVFVGPPASAMADMGDKARSKAIMTAAGVPCVPGYHGPEQEPDQLAARAAEVGYPVLLKSVRGGGGKGMRVVREPEEFAAQLRSARAEASASFGPGGEVMLVERYVVRPRHVEVQVFADRHGNCVALGERDCSVQRRHQKVLEESPAPLLDDATRADLWAKARTAALAVGYVGAGTVEFILDRDSGEFFFMEMNTRLQVEHPVSEMVTGTDLVEWQFRVAAGEPLPLTQDEVAERIRERGAAIEARIYAENPARGFFPDSGRLVHVATPATDAENVRIDAGFGEGDVVSEAYDGMIAKLIVRGPDRTTAIRRLEQALRGYEIVGPSTNVEFLKRLCRSPAFVAGDVETGFIDRWREELFQREDTPSEVFAQAALGSLLLHTNVAGSARSGSGPHGETLGFGAAGVQSERKFSFYVDEPGSDDVNKAAAVDVAVTQTGPSLFTVSVCVRGSETPTVYENVACTASSSSSSSTSSSPSPLSYLPSPPPPPPQITAAGALVATKTRLTSFFPLQRIESTVVRDPARPDSLTVFQHGGRTDLRMAAAGWAEKALGLKEVAASVVAPMPCKILRNEVREGEAVEKGAVLVVIESMKMETVIRSPQKGIIKKLAHKEGDICKAGTVLVLFEEGESPAASE